MNQKLQNSKHNSTPCFEFDVYSPPKNPLPTQNKPSKLVQSEQPKPKSDDYDYGGPGF
ncbi:plasmid mobilization protein, partial [Acinetobacter baumannii]